jgi:hypothetical protein
MRDAIYLGAGIGLLYSISLTERHPGIGTRVCTLCGAGIDSQGNEPAHAPDCLLTRIDALLPMVLRSRFTRTGWAAGLSKSNHHHSRRSP